MTRESDYVAYNRNRLRNQLFENGAIKWAPPGELFTLASGRQSNLYLDLRPTLLTPAGMRAATLAILDLWLRDFYFYHNTSACYIGSMGVGGTLLVGGFLALLNSWNNNRASGFVIREQVKGHGLHNQVEGTVKDDSMVLLLDDVLTSGGTIIRAAKVLPRLDCVYTLVDRQEGGREAIQRAYPNVKVYSLLSRGELIHPPALEPVS